jgi:hypothetical protein
MRAVVISKHRKSFENASNALTLKGLGVMLWIIALVYTAAISTPHASAGQVCSNAALRQGASAVLPDCRVYEQVTPTDKGDATDIFTGHGAESNFVTSDRGIAAEDGNAFLLVSPFSSFAGGESGINSYVFSRQEKGWITNVIAPSLSKPGAVPTRVFDPWDLSLVGVSAETGSQFSDSFSGNIDEFQLTNLIADLSRPSGERYTILSSESGVNATGEEADRIEGASPDLNHIILEGPDHNLLSAATGLDAGAHALYDWSGGKLNLVDLKSSGTLVSLCGARLGQGSNEGGTHNAVWSRGTESKIFFLAPDPGANGSWPSGSECWEGGGKPEYAPQLYMRVDGHETVEISQPEPGVAIGPAEHYPAIYVGAYDDGRKVFFVTRARLTKDDKDSTAAPELYEYNTDTRTLKRVSSGVSGEAEGNVDFVPAVAANGSVVYFAAFGALAAGASSLPEQEGGSANLYRYDSTTKVTSLVAKIGAADYPLEKLESFRWYAGAGNWPPFIGGRRAEEVGLAAGAEWATTGSGRYLVFGTNRPVTGYDSTKAAGVTCENLYPGGANPEKCVELYRYDARAGETKEPSIACLSCGSQRPVDNAMFARSAYIEAPGGTPPRPISEDGSYVFFDTATALVPQTTSGKVHVYEWHDGQVSLISPAGDPASAFFLGSSAGDVGGVNMEGANIFFGSHAQLSAQDTDQSGDLYDARIDGGFPAIALSQCSGAGCQGIPSPPPTFSTPASVIFEGVGNFRLTPKHQAAPTSRSNAKRLKRALRACRRKRDKRKRTMCEARSRARHRRVARSMSSHGRES